PAIALANSLGDQSDCRVRLSDCPPTITTFTPPPRLAGIAPVYVVAVFQREDSIWNSSLGSHSESYADDRHF
ncbi:hypothetical protein ACJEKH_26175, partial [Escherichia coli]